MTFASGVVVIMLLIIVFVRRIDRTVRQKIEREREEEKKRRIKNYEKT